MATVTYRSTITADQSLEFSGASYTPDSGGSLKGNSSDPQVYTDWDLNGATYYVVEAFIGFDLTSPTSGSAPEAGATINSVTLNMNLNDHGSTERTKDVYVYDWGSSVDTGDWRTVSQLQTLYDSGNGLFASYTIPSGWGGATGAHDFTEGDGAAEAVSDAIGGTLRLIVVDAAHRAGSTPTGRGYSSWHSASNSTESNRPLLTIDYTAPVLTPTVTDLSPATGTYAGGTSVTITGTNFTDATDVDFGATAATSYTVDSATQITAVTPAHAVGTVDVTVTTAAGTSATEGTDNDFEFIVPAPTISAAQSGSDIVVTWS